MKYYKLLLLALFCCFSIEVFSQTVAVGSGSYTTQLPPPDQAGRNLNPPGTPRLSGAALSKPVPTSDWWTGLLTFSGANLYNYPMSMRALTNGLVVSYTAQGAGSEDTRQPMSGDMPLLVGVTGLNVTNATVSDHSDWTVTASWGSRLSATMGMGMPFVYFTKGASDVASVTVNMGSASVQGEMILVTNSLGGANFAVYAPAGSSWTANGSTYTSTLAGKNYFSVALLPNGATASTTATAFKQYAYVFPTNTTVSWAYDNATSNLRSTYTVSTSIKEGSGNSVLQALLPHQWAHLSSTSAQPGSYVYNSVRGTMKVLAGNTFVTDNKFKGILSTLPNTAKNSPSFDPGALAEKIDQVKGEALQLWTDSYNDGLLMNKLIQVAKIADQQGNIQARNQIVATVKTRLENWLKAEGGENAFVLYYNSTWTTLIPYPAGHYADANLNDHHFHYGYFIAAAAAIEQFQPGWAAGWGGMVNLMISDAANWNKSNTQFPFLRTFSPYAGHSWAAGLLNNEPHGNNEESSSEAMNFNASLIHWGTITGNTAIRDLGIYLYTTQQTAIEEYWFDQSDRNFPTTYSHIIASRVWGNGVDRGTFWTNDIAATYGIELVPMTASSLYLAHNPAYVNKLWNDMKTRTGVLSNVKNPNLWYDVYWAYLAFVDPAQAITLYNGYTNRDIKFGESDANTYNWIHSLNGAGQVDPSITANYPIAVVFNKAGNKTYVAHNYGSSAITVNYSDGFSMSVPARTMKTNKDIDAKATVTASAVQVPRNGTVTLNATVSGTVTKVEFYRGTTLIGTSTGAPYTVTTAPLAVGKPGFYAKVYNGTAFNLSNTITVLVGAQLPYGGTAWAIPGTIEAGNYDYFEGGSGQGVSYFDATPWNEGGFRPSEAVDAGTDPNEGQTVGYIDAGEWLEYTINVTTGGTYNLALRYTSGNSTGGGPFWLENEAGAKISPDITVTMNDVNWSAYATKQVTGITLPAGRQVIRVKAGSGGFNLGRMTFTHTGGSVTAVTGVSVTPTSASVAVGATQQLTATVAPANATDKSVTWSSSNPAVATVSSTGLVTGVAAGSATITVRTNDGGRTATSTITVTTSTVAVTGVSVTPTSATIAAGGTQQLAATVSPTNATNKAVTWSSSNTAVATVNSSGLVTGVAAGSATITVRTNDGGRTATSAITVTSSPSGHPIPGKIQAEAYSSMNGIQTESTTDTDLGLNVGWIDAGDWMDYSVNVATAGSYNVVYRVASQSGGGSLQMRSGSTTLATTPIPSTGDWQIWTNATATVSLSAGPQIIRLFAGAGGFNINWFQLSSGTTTCNASVVSANISVNGGAWQQTSTASLNVGGSLTMGPNTTATGGSWSWTGPNSFSATTREVPLNNIQSNQAGTYTATFTNSCGTKTTQAFTITVNTVSVTGVTVYEHCNYGGIAVTLPVGTYTTAQLAARGVANNWISSVKVPSGYTVTLYDGDNLTLTSVAHTADYSCLVNNSFNDKTSSIRVAQTSTSGPCTGTGGNGDYSYQVATSGANVNFTFVPLSPISGSNMAILYVRAGTSGAYAGYNMTASGSNFTASVAGTSGQVLSFYFTYRTSLNGPEKNTSATPHSYTVGTTCSATRLDGQDDAGAKISYYPIPVEATLYFENVKEGTPITIRSVNGTNLLQSRVTDKSVDLSQLQKGVYIIQINNGKTVVTKQFIKK